MSEFNGLTPTIARPVYSGSQMRPSLFDVKLVDREGRDSGYILVDANKRDDPIVEFASCGPTLCEALTGQAGSRDVDIRYFTPMFIIATDAQQKIRASIGSFLDEATIKHARPAGRVGAKDVSLHLDSTHILRLADEWLLQRVRHAHSNAESHEGISPGGFYSTAKDHVKDYPSGSFVEYFAEGHDHEIDIQQIPPNQGANDRTFHSGCAAAAWTILLAWHDSYWTPELLKGSQVANGAQYGPDDNPNTESAFDCYIDRVQMGLSRKTATWDPPLFGDQGFTWPHNMKQARLYIEDDLGFGVTGFEELGGGRPELVQRLYDWLSTTRKPCVIQIPWHYCVAAGFLHNQRHPTSTDRQWIKILTGWTGSRVKYIRTEWLEHLWTLQGIIPNDLNYRTFPHTSNSHIELCVEAEGTREIPWAFWLGDDGKIRYIRDPMNSPIVETLTIEGQTVQSMFAPSVVSDGRTFYLVYTELESAVAGEHDVKVLTLHLPKRQAGWKAVEFPDVRSRARPSITGGNGDWFTVALSNNRDGMQLIGTNKDVLQPGAWPAEVRSREFWGSGDRFWIWASTMWVPTRFTLHRINGKTVALYEAGNGASRRLLAMTYLKDGTLRGGATDDVLGRTWGGLVGVARIGSLHYSVREYDYLGSPRIQVDLLDITESNASTTMWQQIADPPSSSSWNLTLKPNGQKGSLDNRPKHTPSICQAIDHLGKRHELVAWCGYDDRLHFRVLSLDDAEDPTSYANEP